jgi:hypothetical protein
MGGDLEGALDRVNVPSYVIGRAWIIRWINPAAEKLVGDVWAASSPRWWRPRTTAAPREAFSKHFIGER